MYVCVFLLVIFYLICKLFQETGLCTQLLLSENESSAFWIIKHNTSSTFRPTDLNSSPLLFSLVNHVLLDR